MIAVQAGAILGDEVRHIADRATIESVVADLAAAAGAAPVDTAGGLWGRLTGAEPDESDDSRGSLLDMRLGRPLHDVLWRRALLGATVVHAAVGAAQLDDRIGLLEEDEPGGPPIPEAPQDDSTSAPDDADGEISPSPGQ